MLIAFSDLIRNLCDFGHAFFLDALNGTRVSPVSSLRIQVFWFHRTKVFAGQRIPCRTFSQSRLPRDHRHPDCPVGIGLAMTALVRKNAAKQRELDQSIRADTVTAFIDSLVSDQLPSLVQRGNTRAARALIGKADTLALACSAAENIHSTSEALPTSPLHGRIRAA